jgi:hypothetical protein
MKRVMVISDSAASSEPLISTEGSVSTLRGAGVDVNFRAVGRVVVSLCMVALAAMVIIFSVAGAHKNDQINRLRDHGVPVTVTVTGCLGLIGGSGSNAAGDSCTGSFTLDGMRHGGAIPGLTFHRPGSTLRAVADPGDPALFTTAHILQGEHASWRVFLLPLVLLVVLVALAAIVIVTWRRPSGRTGRAAPTGSSG